MVNDPVEFELDRFGVVRSGDIQRQTEVAGISQHLVALGTPGARVIHGY